ncbi:MAG: hypothetical protein AABX47_00605 [Nanoarchaeota archaeon]
MVLESYDKDKAQHLFAHCLYSFQRSSHREMSKRELLAKLKKLAQFSVDRSFRSHLAELESKVDILVQKERRLFGVAKKEKAIENGLQGRINSLEEKLGRYIDQKAIHESQIKELETKVQKKMRRRQAVHELKTQIHALQDVYDEIAASRYLYDPAKIRKVESRLNGLKKKLAEMEHDR